MRMGYGVILKPSLLIGEERLSGGCLGGRIGPPRV